MIGVGLQFEPGESRAGSARTGPEGDGDELPRAQLAGIVDIARGFDRGLDVVGGDIGVAQNAGQGLTVADRERQARLGRLGRDLRQLAVGCGVGGVEKRIVIESDLRRIDRRN